MGTVIKVTQTELAGFLQGRTSEEIRRKVDDIRREHPEYDMLLEMAQEVCQDNNVHLPGSPPDSSLTPSELDQLLINMYANTASSTEKQRFIDHLIHSESFYERLLKNFLETHEVMQDAEELTASGEYLGSKSNKELLQSAGILVEKVVEKPRRQAVEPERPEFIQTFVNWMQGEGLRYAIPAAAVVLIAFASPAIWSHYTNPFNKQNFDNAAPFAYDQSVLNEALSSFPSGLRSSATRSENNFLGHFREMGRVLPPTILKPFADRAYRDVVENVALNQQTADSLEKWIISLSDVDSLPDSLSNKLSLAREMVHAYYLHTGSASLALHLSKDDDARSKSKAAHLQDAEKWLSKAKALAAQYEYSSLDEENYFLGLAYAYQYDTAKNKLAIDAFEAVSPESEFYENARKMKEWLQ